MSYCSGKPHLCPDNRPAAVLDPSKNETFATIAAVLADLRSVIPDAYVHLGGDEADVSSWKKSSAIQRWLAAQGNWSLAQGFDYFVMRTHAIAR
jgi:hexosaminidase